MSKELLIVLVDEFKGLSLHPQNEILQLFK